MACPLRFNALRLAGLLAIGTLSTLPGLTEEPIARERVPRSWFAQAEISLQRAGPETVVRSIIHTRFFDRVRDDILGKERKNWGQDPDAAAYCRTLREAFREYAVARGQDRQSALVVDFVTAPSTARVEFAFARVDCDDAGWRIRGRVAWTNLPLSRCYIENNQRLILQEAFGKKAADVVREWAKTAEPLSSPGKAP